MSSSDPTSRGGGDPTRRQALGRGVALGGAALAAASLPALAGAAAALAKDELKGDARVLAGAVGLEQTLVVTYDTAIRSGRLDSAAAGLATAFKRHEEAHVVALAAALEKLDGKPPAAPSAAEVEGLARLRSRAELLEFAIELETMMIAFYYDAQQRLTDTSLFATAASIMANEGQHLALLRKALGRTPAPHAFETGEA
jgi:ferritin-like protein